MPACFRLPLVPLGTLLFTAGCAAPGPYPSLSPRPVERALAETEVEQPPAPLPDDPRIATRIAALLADARRGAAEFETAFATARTAAARAGPPQSESWIDAQQALSRAEAARATTVRALAELDAFSLAEAQSPTTSQADRERLTGAVAEVQAIADSGRGRLAELQASLARL